MSRTVVPGINTDVDTPVDLENSVPGRLRRNFSWMLAGNVIYSACQWGVLVVLAKLGTAAQVGQFALGMAVAAPILLFANLQLNGVQASDARRRHSFGEYFGLRILTTSGALVVVLAICAIARYSMTTALVVLVVALIKALDAISDVAFGLLQQRERMDRVGVAFMCNGVISLGALSVVMALTHNVVLAAAASAAGSAVTAFAVSLPSAARVLDPSARGNFATLKPIFDRQRLLPIAVTAAPLGLVMLLISLNGNVPRYVIEHDIGTAPLGVFAAMAYVTVAGSTIIAALGQASLPAMARAFDRRDVPGFLRLFRRLLVSASILGALAVVIAAVAGHELLTLLYKPSYAEHVGVFVGITAVAAIGFVGACLGYGLTAAREFRIQAPVNAVALLVGLLVCLLLVPGHGLTGAVWGSGAAVLAQLTGTSLALAHAVSARRTRP